MTEDCLANLKPDVGEAEGRRNTPALSSAWRVNAVSLEQRSVAELRNTGQTKCSTVRKGRCEGGGRE